VGLLRHSIHYRSRHQIACIKATEELHTPYRAALSHEYSVASFATLQILSCLHSPGLRCSCCNIVQFCCTLEACNFVTATITEHFHATHDISLLEIIIILVCKNFICGNTSKIYVFLNLASVLTNCSEVSSCEQLRQCEVTNSRHV
jgi:hypothetical protein